MSFPATRAALEAAGYKCKCLTRCRGCQALMEWWLTPAGKTIPMDVMKMAESPAISHFATCPNADQFRKEQPTCCTSPISTSQDSLLFQGSSSSSPESASPSAASGDANRCDEPSEN